MKISTKQLNITEEEAWDEFAKGINLPEIEEGEMTTNMFVLRYKVSASQARTILSSGVSEGTLTRRKVAQDDGRKWAWAYRLAKKEVK